MSLAARIFVNTLLVLAIVLGMTGWWSVADERAALEEITRKHGSAIAQSLAAFSVESLVAQDYPALDKALQSIGASADNIVRMKISQGGRTLVSYGKEGVGDAFSATVVLTNEGMTPRPIGEVEVVLSKQDSQGMIASRINELIVYSLILFFVLAAALHVLIRKVVLQRVAQLSKLTEGVIADQLPEGVPAIYRTDGDELDRLRDRYHVLLSGLAHRERERSTAMLELREAQALLDDVADSLPSSLIVLSRGGGVEYCNAAARAMASVTIIADQAPPLVAVFPQLQAHLVAIEEVVRHNKSLELHRKAWLDQERRRIVDIAIYPLSTRVSGGMVIRIDDVTERTRFEEIMIQSEKMASIGGLAAGIAHEINNPLGVMIQAVQNIERRLSGQLEANQRVAAECGTDMATIATYLGRRNIPEFLEDIKQDGARAAKIVRSLLEFSRKSESRLQPAALPELLEHTVELARKDYDLKKQIDFRRIEVVFEMAPDLPLVPMIRSEIEQVILNLLRNAAQAMMDKFGEEGGGARPAERPRITLRTRLGPDFAEIEVSDNGPGFTEEARKRTFEPFFTTKPPGLGTGLGLWVSYVIVTEKHHGQMLLESVAGQGATFTLRLPL